MIPFKTAVTGRVCVVKPVLSLSIVCEVEIEFTTIIIPAATGTHAMGLLLCQDCICLCTMMLAFEAF